MFGQRIRIVVVERDIYSRQAITSYLSWDRRTHVVDQVSAPHELLADIRDDPSLARLDAVMLDTSLASSPQGLAGLIKMILHHLPDVNIICLAHRIDLETVQSVAGAGGSGYLLREEVGIGLASAVRFILYHRFTVTQTVAQRLTSAEVSLPVNYSVLPERRQYPRLTERIEQALWLCVVEGLPAERTAEEMGVSTSTVRSYIKEGYRILEAEDETVYPPKVSPSERAFLRYSSLEYPELFVTNTDDRPSWTPAA